jgi:hypothetical protein
MAPHEPDRTTPQVHHSDIKDDDVRSGLLCFLDRDRVCGPDCMAYLSDPPAQPDYRGNQWASCMLLVNVHRGGKHLTILAQVASDFTQASRAHVADQARKSQMPPAVPR